MILTINGQQFALKKDKKTKKQTKIENNHYLCKKLISFNYEDIIIASSLEQANDALGILVNMLAILTPQ